MNINQDFVEGLKKDAYEYYFEGFDEHEPIYTKICEVRESQNAYEKGTVLSGPGVLDEKTYAGAYDEVNLTETWTWVIKMHEFGNILPIEGSTVEDLKAKAGDLVRDWAKEWGGADLRVREKKVADIFNKGGYTSGDDDTFDNSIPNVVSDASGDGVYDGTAASPMCLFNLSDNERTAKDGSTYYNGLSLSLTPTNFETAYTRLRRTNAKTEEGDEVALPLNTLGILVTNNADALTARRIFLSENLAGTNLNDINVLRRIVSEDRIIEMPYFDSAAATAGVWAIGCLKKGIRFYNRIGPEFDFWEEKNANILNARIRVRFGWGVIQWRYWVGSNFPTS